MEVVLIIEIVAVVCGMVFAFYVPVKIVLSVVMKKLTDKNHNLLWIDKYIKEPYLTWNSRIFAEAYDDELIKN